MKLFAVLAVLVGLYTFVLLHTTNIVMSQTKQLSQTYQYVADHTDQIASGH